MPELRFTRKELYDYVWEKPLSSLISTYNISYAELKSLLERFDIPVPFNGYWSKLKAGYKVDKIPLSGKFEDSFVITYTPKEKRKRKEKEILESDPIPERLPFDKLIVDAQKICKKKFGERPDNQVHHFGYLTINISVSPVVLDRALSFLDQFIKCLRKNNGDIRIEPHHTWVTIDDVEFEVALREKQTRTLKEKKGYSWNEYDYTPSGTLVFKAGVVSWRSKEWKDGSSPLNHQIPFIIDHLKRSAKEEIDHRINLEKRRLEEANRNKLQAEFERQQAAELAKFTQLHTAFEQWQKAQNMRKYLEELARTRADKGKMSDEFLQWLNWANEKVDWYDPLVEKEDELLKDVDKTTLTVKKKSYW